MGVFYTEKTCGDIQAVDNGAYTADAIPAIPGTKATLACDAGYEAVDSNSIDCTETDGGSGEPSWTRGSSCRGKFTYYSMPSIKLLITTRKMRKV